MESVRKTTTKRDRDGNLSRVGDLKFNKKTKTWGIVQKKKSSKKQAVDFARALRSKGTHAEKLTIKLLKSLGIKYHYQKIIRIDEKRFRYADFYFPALSLIIEIDGGYHNTEEQQAKDAKREKEIKAVKPDVEIIRFSNSDVSCQPDCLFRALMKRIEARFVAIQEAWNG